MANAGRSMDDPELILALDVPDRAAAEATLRPIGDHLRWVKIGLQLFTREGPSIVEAVAEMGYRIFLDLKLHDIPNTVAEAVRSVGSLPVDLLTLHTLGGSEMLQAACSARSEVRPSMRLLGVTVLTSMDDEALAAIGIPDTAAHAVSRLGGLGLSAGLDGLVCSALELAALRNHFGTDPLLVTPGVRPALAQRDEQKRVSTPYQAVRDGASMLVVGRPITRATDPVQAIYSIHQEVRAALKEA